MAGALAFRTYLLEPAATSTVDPGSVFSIGGPVSSDGRDRELRQGHIAVGLGGPLVRLRGSETARTGIKLGRVVPVQADSPT
jgi:hypothetical protein